MLFTVNVSGRVYFLKSEDDFCDGMNRSSSIWAVMYGSESEVTLCIRNVIVFCLDLQNCSLQPAKDIDAYTVHWHCTLYFCLSDEEPKKIIPRSCRYEQQQPQSMMDEGKGACRIASQFGQKLRYVWKNCHFFYSFSCENTLRYELQSFWKTVYKKNALLGQLYCEMRVSFFEAIINIFLPAHVKTSLACFLGCTV